MEFCSPYITFKTETLVDTIGISEDFVEEYFGDFNLCGLFPPGNCLNELPAFVGQLKSLKTLDLSENNIRELPKDLANARCLEVCLCAFYNMYCMC